MVDASKPTHLREFEEATQRSAVAHGEPLNRTVLIPVLVLLAACFPSEGEPDRISAACKDLAAKTAATSVELGFAVKASGPQRIDSLGTRLARIKSRYARTECPSDYLRDVMLRASLPENEEGEPATEPPPPPD
jgi:hypothetical protein